MADAGEADGCPVSSRRWPQPRRCRCPGAGQAPRAGRHCVRSFVGVPCCNSLLPRKRDLNAPRVVYRTARCGLRVTRRQRHRLFGLLRSAGDVWCCVLELNSWRRRRQDAPLAGYRELCRELAASGPGTFGELDSTGARSVLRRYDLRRLVQRRETPQGRARRGARPPPAPRAPGGCRSPPGGTSAARTAGTRGTATWSRPPTSPPATAAAPSRAPPLARGSRTAEPGHTCQACTRPDVTQGDGPHHGPPPRVPWRAPARPTRQPAARGVARPTARSPQTRRPTTGELTGRCT
jgi:hypothetical protein